MKPHFSSAETPALHRGLRRLQIGAELAGNHGSRALDADGVLFDDVCCDRDRARTHAELAQRPARLLGQRDNSRHCRHSFHSICLDPRIRTMVAGPARSGALDCGLFSHRPRPKGRHRYGVVGFLENLRATTERPVDKARPTQAHAARFAGTRALRTSSAVGVSANHFRSTSSARACASSLSA